MSENSPTTDEVLDAYARWENHDCYYEDDVLLTPDGQLDRLRADRWLAKHDAELLYRHADFIRERIDAGEWTHVSSAAIYLYEKARWELDGMDE